jgi:hypothetical protein
MSIQTVEIALPTGIDSVSVGLAEPISIVEVRQGPAGPAGSAVINAATTSDGTAALYLDSIRFEATNGGPTQLGEMAWESNDGSIDAMLESGVIVAMGEDLVIRVRNTTASPITKGTALAYDGTSGASGRIEVKPWVGANIPTAKLFLGFAACDMPANSNGYSQWFGKLTEINTSGGGQAWLDEQIIYAVPGVSATITNVAPTSGEYAAAAVVINAGSGTSGILFVRPTFEVASSTSATANTLVLRDANGGASFGPLSASALSSNQHSITSSAGTNIVGPLALSGSTGDTLTATYNAAITLNSTTGVNVNGGPLSLTQTWTDAAVTYTGLQVNVTDTASNAASLLMDLRVGGVSRLSVTKTGRIGGSTWGLELNSNSIRFGASGSNYALVIPQGSQGLTGVVQVQSTMGIGWSSSTSADLSGSDVILRRDAANTLAQRNGTAAQESRIYGTYTGAGDYRRLALKMSTAGVAQIVAEGAGSGAADNRLEFVTGGATRMTVAADGNVTTSGSITGTGVLTLGSAAASNINLTPGTTGFVDIAKASATGVRETILRAKVSDAGNDAFHIYNATGLNGSFAPGFSGSRFSSNLFAMSFTGQTDAANDSGTSPLIRFDARRTNSQTDPNSGTFSNVETRPLFGWEKGDGSSVGQVSAAGVWSLFATTSSTSTTTGALVVSGGAGIAGNINAGGTIKANSDIEVTDSTKGIILKSPNGTRYRVTVSDLGILSTASL